MCVTVGVSACLASPVRFVCVWLVFLRIDLCIQNKYDYYLVPEQNGASSTVAEPHRRIQSTHRTQQQEPIHRLTKSRPPTGMTQSIHMGAVGFRANGMPVSRSSHQLRIPTPPVIPSNNRKVKKINGRIVDW